MQSGGRAGRWRNDRYSSIDCRLLLSHTQACTTTGFSSVGGSWIKREGSGDRAEGGDRRRGEGAGVAIRPVSPCSQPPPH